MNTDNGPPFNGSKFAKHAQELGFQHRKVTPGGAEVNGFMQTVKKSARVAKIERKAFKQEVQRRLATLVPHSVLVAKVMFNGSFMLTVFTVHLATSSFAIPVLRYANSKNVPAAPCINNY